MGTSPPPAATRPPQDFELRPKVVEEVRKAVELKRMIARAWPETKPWITEKEREPVTKQVRAKRLVMPLLASHARHC